MSDILDAPEQYDPLPKSHFSVLSFFSAIVALFSGLWFSASFVETNDPVIDEERSFLQLTFVAAFYIFCASFSLSIFSTVQSIRKKEPENLFKETGTVLNMAIGIGLLLISFIILS